MTPGPPSPGRTKNRHQWPTFPHRINQSTRADLVQYWQPRRRPQSHSSTTKIGETERRAPQKRSITRQPIKARRGPEIITALVWSALAEHRLWFIQPEHGLTGSSSAPGGAEAIRQKGRKKRAWRFTEFDHIYATQAAQFSLVSGNTFICTLVDD